LPLRIRWTQKEYFGIGLMLFGGCGLIQVFFIFIAQYFLSIGNYLVIILIPLGATFALFYTSTIIFDSYAQVQRKRKIKRRFAKKVFVKARFKRFLEFPIAKPLLIIFLIFTPLFFIAYFISLVWFNNIISFIIAENFGTIFCIFVANLFEKYYAKVQRF